MRFLLFILLFPILFVNAQQPFVSTPSTILSTNLTPNIDNIAQINMVNQTSGTLYLKWLRYTNSLPSTWDYSICDYNTCYSGIPSYGTMVPISGLTQGLIKLSVNPFNYTGTGSVALYVYSGSNFSEGDTLLFHFTAAGVTHHSGEEQVVKSVHIWHSSQHLYIQNDTSEMLDTQVYNLQGQKVAAFTAQAQQLNIYSLATLPQGIYYVRTPHQTQKIGLLE